MAKTNLWFIQFQLGQTLPHVFIEDKRLQMNTVYYQAIAAMLLTTSTKGALCSPSSSVGGLFKTVVTHFSTCVWRKLFQEY